MKNKLELIAHRGYSGITPENTKLSFEAAAIFKFDGVEMDVHLTKDNQLVIIHDEDTARTSLLKMDIASSSLATLKKCDFGKFFKINVEKQTILTLDEFFEQFLDKFKVINIEIKTDIVIYKNIEKLLDECLKRWPGSEKKVIFSSFNFDSLVIMNQINPNYPLALLWWKNAEFKKIDKNKMMDICTYLNPWTKIYKKKREELLKYNKPFYVWTIDNENDFNYFKDDKNIKGLISNHKY